MTTSRKTDAKASGVRFNEPAGQNRIDSLTDAVLAWLDANDQKPISPNSKTELDLRRQLGLPDNWELEREYKRSTD